MQFDLEAINTNEATRQLSTAPSLAQGWFDAGLAEAMAVTISWGQK